MYSIICVNFSSYLLSILFGTYCCVYCLVLASPTEYDYGHQKSGINYLSLFELLKCVKRKFICCIYHFTVPTIV